jgi:hypothetical protein
MRAPQVAGPLLAAIVLTLAGCASAQPQGCGAAGGPADAAACQQQELLNQIYAPGSRLPGW